MSQDTELVRDYQRGTTSLLERINGHHQGSFTQIININFEPVERTVKCLVAFTLSCNVRVGNLKFSRSFFALAQTLKRANSIKVELLDWTGRITGGLTSSRITAAYLIDLGTGRRTGCATMECKAAGRTSLLMMGPLTLGLWR